MSKKSRARADGRMAEKPTAYCLDRQKLTAREAARTSVTTALIFLTFIVLTLVLGLMAGEEGRIALWGLVVLVPVGTVYLVRAIQRNKLNRAIQKISCSNLTETDIHCTKARFMTQRIAKYSSVIAVIVLQSEMGETFFYVYPKGEERSDYMTVALKNSLVGYELTLVCYADTHIVQSFHNKHS